MTNKYVYAYRDDLIMIIDNFNRGAFTRIDLQEKCNIDMSKIKKMTARELLERGKKKKDIDGTILTTWTVPHIIIKTVEKYKSN